MRTQDIIRNIKDIYQTESYMNTLMDFERVLDSVHLYVYDNWIKGELVQGPIIEKHWVSCAFMWPYKKMPEPLGAKRLLDYNIKVEYRKDELERPVKVKTINDYKENTNYPKLEVSPIWIVEIRIPRKLMEDIYRGTVEVEGEQLDFSDIDEAYFEDIDAEGLVEDEENELE